MNQQRHAQKSNSRLNSFQWGSKLVGHPVFFLLGPSSFELTPREGKRIGHTTTESGCRPSNKTFGFFSIIPFTYVACSSFSCYKTTPKIRAAETVQYPNKYVQKVIITTHFLLLGLLLLCFGMQNRLPFQP